METMGKIGNPRPLTGDPEFGARLRFLRKQLGIAPTTIAENTSIDSTSLSRIENGKQWVSPKALRELAKEMGVGVEEFFKSSAVNGSKSQSDGSLPTTFRAILSGLASLNEYELSIVLRTIQGLRGGGSGSGQSQDPHQGIKGSKG